MFKKATIAIVLVAAGSMLSLQAANAQDVYATGQTQGMFEKSGWYVGADLGGAFNPGVTTWNCNNCQGVVNTVNRIIQNKGNSGAVTGGLYGGYQYKWQYPIVTGFEVDFNGLGDIRKNDSVSCTGGTAPCTNLAAGTYTLTTNRNTNYFGTVRGHFGYIPAPNQEIYLSGGFAYAGNSGAGQATVTYQPTTGGAVSQVFRSSNSGNKTGSAVGGGYSYAFNDNMAIRIEGMYIDLGTQDRSFTFQGQTYSISESAKFHFTVVRAGFTYKFDM